MRNMLKTVTGLIFCLSIMANAIGQSLYSMSPPAKNGQSKDFIPASPSAAGLGIFGQVPIGNYTGTANVSVPFYTVNYKELNVPIGISYHAAGIKPDYFPGITGLGWALSAGGSITRVVKGMPDFEYYDIGNQPIPVLYNPTEGDDWNKLTTLKAQLKSGGFYTDQDRTNPDEFYFNFNGFTGKFYMNQTSTTFKIKSSNNNYFTVKADLAINKYVAVPRLPQDPDVPYDLLHDTLDSRIFQYRLVYKITITDVYGVKYIFGGNDNSIEFSRPGHSSINPPRLTIHNLITPNTWHLTSIVSPNGYSITFNYERGCVVTKVPFSDVMRSRWYKQGSSGPITGVLPFNVVLGEKSTLVNACYLSSITTPKETLSFSYSDASSQLQFPTDPNKYQGSTTNENSFTFYKDIAQANTESMMGKKLDAIDIRDVNNVYNKGIRFAYTGNTNTRLKLLSATVLGNDRSFGPTWSFSYNSTPLPSYLSLKTDHYGYYNGHNTYMITDVPEYYLNLDQQAFFDSRGPELVPAQAEVLTRITYPTGGFSTFEYELNEYGAKVTTWPFSTAAAANSNSGGLRVTKIKSFTAEGQEASAKEYHYVKDYINGGTVSSGVLAYEPSYYEALSGTVVPPSRYSTSTSAYNGTINIEHWSSNPIFPLAETRGNNVTYSEVTEVNKDGSAVVYKYKNYDNGYNDLEFPHAPNEDTKVTDNVEIKQWWTEDEGISMDLERGQILSEWYYDAAHVLKSKKEYEYNNDPARFDDNVRVLMQSWNILKRCDIPSLRITSNLIYTYFPYLKKVTQTEYEPNQTPHETVINYEYNNEYRLMKKQETTAGDGRKITLLNTFSGDLPTSAPYDELNTQGKVGLLVSNEHQVNDVMVAKSTTVFGKNLSGNTALILPQLVKTQYKTNPEEVKTNFNQYDIKGNLVCSSPQDGFKTCIVWSYNYTYPVAKIINADYATVLNVLGGQAAVDAFATSMPNNSTLNSFLAPLRTDTRLSAAFVSSYTYDLLMGMTSETDANNRPTYYEYDYMGRLNIVRDHNNNIVKKLCYNYAGLPENCGAAPLYEETELWFTANPSVICSSSPVLQVVMGYTKRPDPESPLSLSIPEQFFADKEFTTLLPDGYYKLADKPRLYYHIENGKTGGLFYACP